MCDEVLAGAIAASSKRMEGSKPIKRRFSGAAVGKSRIQLLNANGRNKIKIFSIRVNSTIQEVEWEMKSYGKLIFDLPLIFFLLPETFDPPQKPSKSIPFLLLLPHVKLC